jgi:RNA polymerase sigma-70 factor, ECF subfamily
VPARDDVRDRDDEWVRMLYEQHGSALLAYATRLTGDRRAAEDVVQETLVRAWRHRAKLHREDKSVRGWLFTVTRNLVYDRSRARQSRPVEVAVPEYDTTVMSLADPADAVVNSVAVLDALDTLSEDHRAALVSIYYGGLTTAEAAEQLGIPVGTVKSRVHYALRALRVVLDERRVSAGESP